MLEPLGPEDADPIVPAAGRLDREEIITQHVAGERILDWDQAIALDAEDGGQNLVVQGFA